MAEQVEIQKNLRPKGMAAFAVIFIGVIFIVGCFGVFSGKTLAVSNSGTYFYEGLSARLLGGAYVFLAILFFFATGKYRFFLKLREVRHDTRKKIVCVLLLAFVSLLSAAIITEA